MGARGAKGSAAGDGECSNETGCQLSRHVMDFPLTFIVDAEELVPEMMAHLRQQATRKLEAERWMYEPTLANSTY